MFEDLLPEIEKSIANSTGSIPVVFKGMERQYAKGEITPSKNQHEFHELLYMRNGSAQLEINKKKISVSKRDILIIRPNISHKIFVNEGTADMIVLYFGFKNAANLENIARNANYPANIPYAVTKLTIESFIQFASGENTPPFSDDYLDPFLTIKGKNRLDIAGIVERIFKESKSDAYGKDLMMQFLTMELLVSLSRGLREEWEDSIRVRTGKAKELVEIAREFLVENHERNISISEVATYVFLSQSYFTRAFREHIGMSPMSFLIQLRLDHACQLLEQKDIKISGIAKQVGFTSTQRFNEAFRKHMGIAPMKYRKTL